MTCWRIRAAKPEDADLLAALEGEAMGPASWGAQSVREGLGAPYVQCFFATGDDGAPGGYALWRRLGGEAEILSLGVRPAARGKGAADALVTAVLDAARQAGLSAVFLEVDAGNAPGRALYAKHGFARIGERRAYYRNGADALVLRRGL